MRFNSTAFDRFLGDIGQKVLWRKSYSCACVNPNSGAPDPKHALCSGKGRIWAAPVETTIGIGSQGQMAKWIEAGVFGVGDLSVIIQQASPAWECGQYDRICMLNATDQFSLALVRGAPSERLAFAVAKVSRCFWLSPAPERAIVEGGLPVVANDGSLSWPSGGEPPAGTSYSLTGERYAEYYLLDELPSSRNQHAGMRLPKRAVLRRWDLFGR